MKQYFLEQWDEVQTWRRANQVKFWALASVAGGIGYGLGSWLG